ncbi:restriction endonuclease subunit S [Streptomyces sp. NPDC047821]|uniref:restriction endonuclease subunit S n=1 Tax=Streptomyces sp. NPDC047821 TaxID=3365488 RepID=UPI003720B5B9
MLTISAAHGLVSQREFFNRPVAGADLSQYYLLRAGDFAYNRSHSDGWPAGVVRTLDRYDSGVVSPLYICFRPDATVVDPSYLRHYFTSGVLDKDILWIAKEGVRNHGLLNVRVDDFFDLELRLPALPEQRRIAEVLDEADAQEAALRALREKTCRWLDGVRHHLLKGEDDWTWTAIDQLGKVVTGRTPEVGPPLAEGRGIPFVTPSEIDDGGVVRGSAREAARGAEGVVRIPSGATLVVCIGFGTGKVGLLEHEACVNQQINAVVPADRVDPYFLFQAISGVSNQVKSAASMQVTPIINKSRFSAIQVRVPSYERQREIAGALRQAGRTVDDIDAQMRKVRLFRKALARDLLTGAVGASPEISPAA